MGSVLDGHFPLDTPVTIETDEKDGAANPGLLSPRPRAKDVTPAI
jgi:hypothetical protein